MYHCKMADNVANGAGATLNIHYFQAKQTVNLTLCKPLH